MSFLIPLAGAAMGALSSLFDQNNQVDEFNKAKQRGLDYLDSIIPSEADINREVSYARRTAGAQLGAAANRYAVAGRSLGNKSAFMGAALGPYSAQLGETILNSRERMRRWSQMLKLKRADLAATPDATVNAGDVFGSAIAGGQAGLAVTDAIQNQKWFDKILGEKTGGNTGGIVNAGGGGDYWNDNMKITQESPWNERMGKIIGGGAFTKPKGNPITEFLEPKGMGGIERRGYDISVGQPMVGVSEFAPNPMKYDNWGGTRQDLSVRSDGRYELSGAFDNSFGDRQGAGFIDARLPIPEMEMRDSGGIKTNTRKAVRPFGMATNARDFGAAQLKRRAQLEKWRRFGLNRSSAGSLYQ